MVVLMHAFQVGTLLFLDDYHFLMGENIDLGWYAFGGHLFSM